MARDRLAALRAQQQAGYGDNATYPLRAGGYQCRISTLYSHQEDRYEMSEEAKHNASPIGGDLDNGMSAFYSEISTIQDLLRSFNDNVSRISDLHSRSLNSVSGPAMQQNINQLDGMVEETGILSNELKIRVKNLQKQRGDGRDGEIRKQQTGLVKQRFIEAIQNYQQVEQQYRFKYKQRMERQLKIIKPDATPEEVKAVVDDDQGGQIFVQALQSSNRYGESRAVHREVQERHKDIKRIERTLHELGQLFNDMSIIVLQQDESINNAQKTAMDVESNAGIGLQYAAKAVSSARTARKKQWICLFMVLVLFLTFGIIIIVIVTENQNNNQN